jgi:hypothetical protein
MVSWPQRESTMKDQYFGDINDYRKYGLLRSIIAASQLRVMVAWMLTPDDKSTDGKFVSYLKNGHKWSRYDAKLFEQLRALSTNVEKRQVSMIESAELLPNAEYFSAHVPDSSSARTTWFDLFHNERKEASLFFSIPITGWK